MAGARWHRRLFRVLLRVFPAEFRERFAAEMVGDFQEQLDEVRPCGARRLIGLWLRTGRDLLRQARAEHLDILRRDLLLSARSCRRHPTLALTIVLTLAVAVGLNTAVFSVVDGVLLRQLPFDREDRLVALHELRPGPDRQRRGVSPVNFADWTSRVTTLEAMTLVRMSEITLPGDEYPVRTQVMAVSDNFFRLFPAVPALGRLLHRGDYEAPVSAGERSAPGHAALVLSHTLWQQHFGGRAEAIGDILHLDAGRTGEIVGVLPPDFPFHTLPGQGRAEAWMSDVSDPPLPRAVRFGMALGRLAREESIATAQTEMDVIAGVLGEAYPETNAGWGIEVSRIHDTTVADVRAQMWFLFAAAGCVLLIACANIASLLLAYQSGQRHDLAVRVALGGTRARLFRQSLTHSLALSAVGGTAGAMLAFGAVPALIALAPAAIPRLDDITVDARVLLFSLIVTTLTGVACGLVSCVTIGRRTGVSVLRLTGSDARGGGRRLRHALVVAEVALALMLVVAAGLMVRTLRAVGALDLGFDPGGVVSIGLTPDTLAWMTAGRTKAELEATLLERIRARPSVIAAGIGSRPLGGGAGLGITVRLPRSPDEPVGHPVDVVSPGYLEALGARLVQGRFFEPQDESSPSRMAIVNEAAARAGWAAGAALGDRVVIGDEPVEVIGVIGDVRRHALEEAPPPTLYLLSGQWPGFWTNNVLVRTRGDPLAELPSVRAIMRDVDPTQALSRIHTMDDALAAARAPRRFTFWLIGLFSAIAVGLAGMGVYSLAAESVSQRQPELGIRIALGATPIRIVRLVAVQGGRLSVTGITVGLLGAAALNRTMEGLIFGIETTDVFAHGAAALVLTLATVGACVQPARRAVHVDPVTALRTE